MARLGFTLKSDSRSACRENRVKKEEQGEGYQKDAVWTGQRGGRRDRKGPRAPDWAWASGEGQAGLCLHGRPQGLKLPSGCDEDRGQGRASRFQL